MLLLLLVLLLVLVLLPLLLLLRIKSSGGYTLDVLLEKPGASSNSS